MATALSASLAIIATAATVTTNSLDITRMALSAIHSLIHLTTTADLESDSSEIR